MVVKVCLGVCSSNRRGAIFVGRWPESEVYHGTYGDPALATKENAKLYFEALIDSISQTILDFGKGKFDPANSDGSPTDFNIQPKTQKNRKSKLEPYEDRGRGHH